MSTAPFYLGDIVRITKTGYESRVHGVHAGGVLLPIGDDLQRVSFDQVEMVTPASAVNALRDPKFQVWFDQQMANAFDQGVFESTGYLPGEAFGLVIKPYNPYRRTEQ
jgi:hypothetical protein